MPIRFRCPHCNQLLGIARRKAGTLVSCPTCQRNVLVPAEDAGWAENGPPAAEPPAPAPVQAPGPLPAPAPAPVPSPALFERDDFDVLLRPQPSLAGDVPRPAPAPVPARGPDVGPQLLPPPPLPEQAPVWPPAPLPLPAGLVLSPTRATVLTVIVILLLAVAFGAGLLVGRFYL